MLLEALEQDKEPTLPELLHQYLELRSGQCADWTSKGKLKDTVADFRKVQVALCNSVRKSIPRRNFHRLLLHHRALYSQSF